MPLVLSMLVPAAWAADGSGAPLIGGLVALGAVCAALVATRRPAGLVVSAVSGLGLALYLFVQHHAAKAGAGESACNISAAINCDAVNTSRWSEIGGVPIALLGAGYFAAVAYLAVRHARGVSSGGALLAALSGAALTYDAFLAWASADMGALCVLCATTWFLNALLFVGALAEHRRSGVAFGPSLRSAVGTEGLQGAIVGVGVMIVGAVALPGASSPGGAASAGASAPGVAAYVEAVAGRIELDGTEPVAGPADARFTLVEWADFECPHCAMMVAELEAVLAEHKDVRLLFKHYPISGLCNRNVDGVRHQNACSAAAAADCAGRQNAFYELSHRMFKNQEYLQPDDIRFLAKEIQLDMTAFEACWADPSTMDGVRRDVDGGTTAGVQGTPAVFLKGAFGDQWVRVKGGRDAINAVLAAARSGAPMPPVPAPSGD
ncbi:MAG: hypothetical protein RLZZ299_2698 [Pseudomonadota bacterium]|jgi:protein-disulfide isomerase